MLSNLHKSRAGRPHLPLVYTLGPAFRMEAQTQRRAQTKCKSICTKVGRQRAKTAEPKMAFNFAHLLSAACGGAPHRLRRLRRPCALGALSARPCCGFWASWGAGSARFVPDFDVSGKTAEPKMAFNFAHLLSAACGGAPRRLGRLRRPCGSVCRWRYTAPVRHTATLWRAGAGGGGTTTQSRLLQAREWLLCLRKWASLVPHP